jgi:stage V sporulation protein G
MATVKEKQESAAFDCLAVTQVQVFPREDNALSSLKAFADVVLNDQFLIRGLRVMDGEYGLFVAYPTDPFFKGDEYRDICCPIARNLREHIENCVLEKYRAAIA